jgi:hypothetical protein
VTWQGWLVSGIGLVAIIVVTTTVKSVTGHAIDAAVVILYLIVALSSGGTKRLPRPVRDSRTTRSRPERLRKRS